MDGPTASAPVSVDARYLRRPDVGISIYVGEMISALVEGGIDVVLLTDGDDHVAELRARWPSADVRSLGSRSGLLWEQMLLPRALRTLRPSAHIAGANYGLPLRRSGTRLIQVVHDLIPLRMPWTYLVSRPAWGLKYLISTAIALVRADVVVAVSEATARDVGRFRRRRPTLVRYPSLSDIATTATSPPPEHWPATYFVYQGGRDPRKNVPRLLEAFAHYRRAGGESSLVLLGSGYEEHDAHIDELGIDGAVIMPGYVDLATKVAAVAGAVAVVYPSSWEGFGLPILEGFMLGTPVVSGRGGAMAEVGGDAPIYVDVTSARAICEGLEAVQDPARRARALALADLQLDVLGRRADGRDPLVSLLAGG